MQVLVPCVNSRLEYQNFLPSILGDKLYIIMDLIDGAPLGEHFNALKEKQQTFGEDRLWNIFIQVYLYYIISLN